MKNSDSFLKQIKAFVGENCLTVEPSELSAYSHDEFATDEYNTLPLAVVKPTREEQVSEVLKACSEWSIPVTARGGGTGLSAGCVPSKRGIVLSLEKLNKKIEVDEENLCITVEAGVTLKQLYDVAEEAGLFFPPHPGDESATVGGMIATNAGGARAVKYGTIKQFVRGLKVALADGEIISLGGKILKSSTGYHLLDLMIGSEGTLGVVTEITLSLLPPPGTIETLVVPFATVEEAIDSVSVLFKIGVIPFAVEFIEHPVLAFVERLLNKSWPTKEGAASLLIMLDGPGKEEVLATAEKIGEALEGYGALDVLLAEHKERQEEILSLRSMIYEALRPGTGELFDICVPRSEISGHVRFIHRLEKESGVPLPTYGHAADGNVHTHSMKVGLVESGMGEPIPDWFEKHRKIRESIYDDIVKRGGVISGEHGIGLVKRDFLLKNIGGRNVELMKALKKAFDPKGILNPGILFL
ncbi:MAG: FAD-binding oxidoreductase [Spirochaetes bacterium]|nr:MAG: FAD-binding oxidoreductase [Spirochaetota bacterium]